LALVLGEQGALSRLGDSKNSMHRLGGALLGGGSLFFRLLSQRKHQMLLFLVRLKLNPCIAATRFFSGCLGM
jgi:hypothetical protein